MDTLNLDEPERSTRAESGYRGVTRCPCNSKYKATFGSLTIGIFETAHEAAMAWARHPVVREKRIAEAKRHEAMASTSMSLAKCQAIAKAEGLTLVQAPNKAGYRGVIVEHSMERDYPPFVPNLPERPHFWTAWEASLCFERAEARLAAAEAASATAEPEPDAIDPEAWDTMSREEAERLAAADGLRLIKAPGTKSGYKGVKAKEQWFAGALTVRYSAGLMREGVTHWLGTYSSPHAAALKLARDPDFASRAHDAVGRPTPYKNNEDRLIAATAARSTASAANGASSVGVGGADADMADAEATTLTRRRKREEAARPLEARLAKRRAGARGPPECIICMEALHSAAWGDTPCGHAFHVDCLRQWLDVNVTCPQCRYKYGTTPKFVSTRRMFLQTHEPRDEATATCDETGAQPKKLKWWQLPSR